MGCLRPRPGIDFTPAAVLLNGCPGMAKLAAAREVVQAVRQR